MIYDVIIIGGGAAGLGAALYSARYNLKTLIIAKEFGGTGNIAHKVDNWIGEPGISGMDLMDKFIDHVDSYGVEKIEDEILSINKKKNLFEVQGKKKYTSKSVIYSLGMVHKELGVEGEKEYAGKGIHYCYTCDGPIYSGKNVIMVGGGDSAGWGSVFLSEHAKSVTTLVRKDKMKAEPITVKQMEENPKININYNTEIKKFYGDALPFLHCYDTCIVMFEDIFMGRHYYEYRAITKFLNLEERPEIYFKYHKMFKNYGE